MRVAWTIARREMFSYFVSPMAYMVLTAWLLWCGWQYYILAGFFASQPASSPTSSPLSAFFGGSILFFIPLLVFAPVMTMRLVAVERDSGTLEPLLTAPVTPLQVVLGKYIAALVFSAVAAAACSAVAVVLASLAHPPKAFALTFSAVAAAA